MKKLINLIKQLININEKTLKTSKILAKNIENQRKPRKSTETPKKNYTKVSVFFIFLSARFQLSFSS